MKSIYVCVCANVYVPCACRYPQRLEEVTRSPRSGVRDSCESSDVGAEDWAPVLWKSRKCSRLLNHLLCSWLDFLKNFWKFAHESNALSLLYPCQVNACLFPQESTFRLQLLKSLLTAGGSHGCDPDLGKCPVSVVGSFLALSLRGVPPGMQCSYLPAVLCSGQVSRGHFIEVLLSLNGFGREILE